MRNATHTAGLLGLALVFGSIASGNQQARPNYYPLKEGSKWQYRVDSMGKSATVTMHAAKIEKIDNIDLFRMEALVEGKVVAATEHMTSDDRGIFRHRVNGQPLSKPLTMLKYPVTSGETWKEEIEIGGEKSTFQIMVLKEEDVQVPAGKFKATAVQLDFESNGIKMSTTNWFVANVGIVKQSMDVGGFAVRMELEKYEPVR